MAFGTLQNFVLIIIEVVEVASAHGFLCRFDFPTVMMFFGENGRRKGGKNIKGSAVGAFAKGNVTH